MRSDNTPSRGSDCYYKTKSVSPEVAPIRHVSTLISFKCALGTFYCVCTLHKPMIGTSWSSFLYCVMMQIKDKICHKLNLLLKLKVAPGH